MPKLNSDREKLLERKREKAKLAATKEEEKLEKRRAKEEAAKLRKLIDKEKELEKKMKRKSKPNGSKNMIEGTALSDFIQSEKNRVPLFMEKCVEFIEQEGLDSEGIYRVPGNRAHVELLYQKLQEGKQTRTTYDMRQLYSIKLQNEEKCSLFFLLHVSPK